MGAMREFRFDSRDGTSLLGFDNEGTGPRVVMVPGLATPPEGLPSLLRPDNGFRVVGFTMRGTHGSDRPSDPRRIRVEDHAGDAQALMDHVGWSSAVFVGWSLGVNIAFQVAVSAPERVLGIVAIGGVPGDSFDHSFAPFGVPRPLSRPLVRALYTIGRRTGALLGPAVRPIPLTAGTTSVMNRARLLAGGDSTEMAAFLERHLKQDLAWLSELARAADEHERLDIYHLAIPMAFIAGTNDYLTSAEAVIATAREVPHASLDVVRGTHPLGVEHPELVLQRLAEVCRQAGPSVT